MRLGGTTFKIEKVNWVVADIPHQKKKGGKGRIPSRLLVFPGGFQATFLFSVVFRFPNWKDQ
jgi:hypothetical protein